MILKLGTGDVLKTDLKVGFMTNESQFIYISKGGNVFK